MKITTNKRDSLTALTVARLAQLVNDRDNLVTNTDLTNEEYHKTRNSYDNMILIELERLQKVVKSDIIYNNQCITKK